MISLGMSTVRRAPLEDQGEWYGPASTGLGRCELRSCADRRHNHGRPKRQIKTLRPQSDGIVRTYEYNERNNLVGVREPGRILQNWFDDAGRWVGQVLKDSEYDDHP